MTKGRPPHHPRSDTGRLPARRAASGGRCRMPHLLLCAEGERQVQSVLPQIDAIEALGIDPVAVSTAYWSTLGNRLSARLPLPAYTVERHAAYLAGEVLR